MDNNFDFGCHGNEIWNEAKFLCQVLTACKISNKSNRRLLGYWTFIFSLSFSIASVTSYVSENEAENLQNGDIHLTQIPDFEMEYLENHLAHWGRWWLVFFPFFTLFHLSLTFFRPEVPFKGHQPSSVPLYFLGTSDNSLQKELAFLHSVTKT